MREDIRFMYLLRKNQPSFNIAIILEILMTVSPKDVLSQSISPNSCHNLSKPKLPLTPAGTHTHLDMRISISQFCDQISGSFLQYGLCLCLSD